MRYVVSVLLLIGLVAVATSQPCWGQPSIPARSVQVAAVRVHVERHPLHAEQYAVFLDGKQIGSVHAGRRIFQAYDAASDRWGPVEWPLDSIGWKAGKCGCEDCRCIAVGQETDWRENGVDCNKLRGPRITGAGEIPDDSKKLRVTLIGNKADRDRVAAEVKQVEPDKTLLWSVPADHFSLHDLQKKDGSPTVYVQAPDGKVLHRQDDGRDAATAIRKAVKGYDPAKDPDLRKNDPAPSTPTSSTIPILIAAAFAAMWFLKKGA